VKIRINGQDMTPDPDDGQTVAGTVVGGRLVQSGRGSQTVIGCVVGGDVIQSGGDDDEDARRR
jgi:hypothetical protein